MLYYGALNLYYWALLYIPLGLCTVLGYTFPFITAVVAHFGCCGEHEVLSAAGWGCCLLGFVGVALVVDPWSGKHLNSDAAYGISLTCGSAVCWGLQIMLIRKTRSTAHWLQVEMVTAVVHSFLITPCAWLVQYAVLSTTNNRCCDNIVQLTMPRIYWAYCVAIGLVAFVGLGCSTRGFQIEQAPRGAMIMYLEIPFMYGT